MVLVQPLVCFKGINEISSCVVTCVRDKSLLLQPDWRQQRNKMELLALIIIDRHDALVFPGSTLLKSVSRKRLRHLCGKSSSSPKVRHCSRCHLGIAERIKSE